MGTKSKIKRVHLELNENHESFFLGVVSAEPDYKLSLSLNKSLNISLRSVTPVNIEESGVKIIFTRFSDPSHAPYLIYDLISNRSEKHFLFKKIKNIDYIFQVHDPHNDIDKIDLVTKIRDSEYITAVFNLDNNLLKDKNLIHLLIH